MTAPIEELQQLEALFDSSSSAHDERWRRIPAEESEVVRRAVVFAQEMREQREDPGDAFLRGLAVGLTALRTAEQGTTTHGEDEAA